MIKKITILLSILWTAISLYGQLPVGGWTLHSPFNGVSKIAETKGMTYYLSSGSLFSVDKKTQEVRALNNGNILNGAPITGIYPHPEGKYLIVTYENCNMDKLLDDGSVVNIPDISNALLTGRPSINHVGFGKDKFYVSASFGLVTFNDKKNETLETMFTPNPVTAAFGLGDYVVIHYDRHLRSASQSERIVSLDQTHLMSDWAFDLHGAAPVGDKRLVMLVGSANNQEVSVADFDFDNMTAATTGLRQNNNIVRGIKHLLSMDAQKVAVSQEGSWFTFDPGCPANQPAVTAFPAVLKGNALSAMNGFSEVWAGNADGICKFDISTSGTATQLCDRFGKTDFATANCNRIFTQPDGSLYFWREDEEGGFQYGFSGTAPLILSQRDSNKDFYNISPTKISNNGNAISSVPRPFWVTQDQHDPDAYFVTTWNNGVYRFKNGEQTHQLTNANSPLDSKFSYRIAFAGFDAFGNLWVAQERPLYDHDNIHAISYSDLMKENTSASDWHTFDALNRIYRCTVGCTLFAHKMMVFARGHWANTVLTFINQKNTPSFDDDQLIQATTFIDQDNKTFSFSHVCALAEDKKGRLWVGTNMGVFEITDPSKITSDIVNINHLKVPRNDGTGLADYLLDAITVTGIAVDSSNRKWLSTTTSGVYLVSEDGDQIIEHYTTENSILPSNKVFSVACDPNSSSVFFATANGVVEYNSTSMPPSENLDNVYAYPNPVRPDYSGWITVTGLMDNTLVKIADSAGNVFFQGRSEGGMITWDGCNAAGDRVKTGVYYVFASQGTSNDSGSDACVTKIMVIN